MSEPKRPDLGLIDNQIGMDSNDPESWTDRELLVRYALHLEQERDALRATVERYSQPEPGAVSPKPPYITFSSGPAVYVYAAQYDRLKARLEAIEGLKPYRVDRDGNRFECSAEEIERLLDGGKDE